MSLISVTVAAVVEEHGKFLLVEEQTDEGLRINQPAGHLEPDESIIAAATREMLEESAYHFSPTALVGVYRWRHQANNVIYLRFALCGPAAGHEPQRRLDEGIVRALWLSVEELQACAHAHRSPLVLRCVQDYLAGRRYPLELLVHYD